MSDSRVQALCDRFADLFPIEKTEQYLARGACPALDHIDSAHSLIRNVMIYAERILCCLPVRGKGSQTGNVAGIRCDAKVKFFCVIVFCLYIPVTGKIREFHSHFFQIHRNLKPLIIFLQIIIKSQTGTDTVPVRVYMPKDHDGLLSFQHLIKNSQKFRLL